MLARSEGAYHLRKTRLLRARFCFCFDTCLVLTEYQTKLYDCFRYQFDTNSMTHGEFSMETEMVENEIVFTLRVSATLNEKLVKSAKTENRSRQAQIVYLLNKHFETANSSGKKEKAK
jgi:hypothetical protein